MIARTLIKSRTINKPKRQTPAGKNSTQGSGPGKKPLDWAQIRRRGLLLRTSQAYSGDNRQLGYSNN